MIRHALALASGLSSLALTVSCLPLGVEPASTRRGLVAPPGFPLALLSGGQRALWTAVVLTPITRPADRRLPTTASTQKEPYILLHPSLRLAVLAFQFPGWRWRRQGSASPPASRLRP